MVFTADIIKGRASNVNKTPGDSLHSLNVESSATVHFVFKDSVSCRLRSGYPKAANAVDHISRW